MGQKHEGTSRVDGNVPYLDKDLTQVCAFIRTHQINGMLKGCAFHCMQALPQTGKKQSHKYCSPEYVKYTDIYNLL